jgi:hypothetical protein
VSWLRRIGKTFYGEPTPATTELYRSQPGDPLAIYQSPDFPHVFLGGADISDIQEAAQIAGIPVNGFRRFNVAAQDTKKEEGQMGSVPFFSANLPEASHQTGGLMDQWMYEAAQTEFNQIADTLAQAIISSNQPIYVHCHAGKNRSASVLAAALTAITNKSLVDILREMKEQRGMVAPHDAYFMMAAEYSKNDPDDWKQQIQQKLDLDYAPSQELQVEEPVNVPVIAWGRL